MTDPGVTQESPFVQLKFAPHLGFPNPDRPLFAEAVGSADPVAQIRFIEQHGFQAVFDPFAAARNPDEQRLVGDAAADHGLAMGSLLYCRFADFEHARWGRRDREARELNLRTIRSAFDVATRLRSSQIAIISFLEENVPHAEQLDAMGENLRRAGDIALDFGMTLCVEGMAINRIPNSLLRGMREAASVVRAAAHPAVRMLLDSGHSHGTGEDEAEQMAQHWDIVAAVQLADSAGRVEMGGGEIHFRRLLDLLSEQKYRGLLELEHGWSRPGAEVQFAYIDYLKNSGWRSQEADPSATVHDC